MKWSDKYRVYRNIWEPIQSQIGDTKTKKKVRMNN